MSTLANSETVFDSIYHANPWIQLATGAGLVFAAFITSRLTRRDKDDSSNIGCLVVVIGITGLVIVFHALGVMD